MEALFGILKWIQLNPKSFGAFLIAVLGIGFKAYLQVTGNSDHLAAWNASAESYVDAAVALLVTYGTLVGINHATRGPDLPPVQQAALPVSALQPAPVPQAMETVKETTEEIIAPDPPPDPPKPKATKKAKSS